jgi:hypothetical protein
MSLTELIVAYLAERARLTVFAPLAVLIAFTSWLAAPPGEASLVAFAGCATQALLLALAFRVWDDLEDRSRDAVRHPERVTVRAHRGAPLVGLALVFTAAGVLPLFGGTFVAARLAILACTAIGLAIWYAARPALPSRFGGLVVLAKYPAIAMALAPRLADVSIVRAGTCAVVLFVIVGLFELLDDRSLFRGIA